MNPVEEFQLLVKTSSEKKADLGNFMRALPGRAAEQALGAGTNALIGAGMVGAGIAAQKLYDAATKARDFRKMLEHNPDLHEMHQADPNTFNAMFSSLRTMNPAFSKEPIVAGTYMRQMMNSPMNAGEFAVRALEGRGNLPDHFRGLGSDALKTQFNPSQYGSAEQQLPQAQLDSLRSQGIARDAQEARAQEAYGFDMEQRRAQAAGAGGPGPASSRASTAFTGGSPMVNQGVRQAGGFGTPSPRPSRMGVPGPRQVPPGFGRGFVGPGKPLCSSSAPSEGTQRKPVL